MVLAQVQERRFSLRGWCYSSIIGGNIKWVHGSLPCGSYSDLRSFCLGLKNSLQRNEKLIADQGYPDMCCSRDVFYEDSLSFSYIRARHGAISKRSKQFKVLGHCFRHSLQLHAQCFFCNIMQLTKTVNTFLCNTKNKPSNHIFPLCSLYTESCFFE